MNNNTAAKTIAIVVPIVVALGVIFFVQSNRNNNLKNQTPNQPTITAEKPTSTNTPTTIKDTPTSDTQTDTQIIKNLLVDKNKWTDPDIIEVIITQTDGQYATGSIGETNTPAGGGMWFAAKVDDQWQIVWDGNGAILCQDLEPYPEYPTSIIPECWDADANQVIIR